MSTRHPASPCRRRLCLLALILFLPSLGLVGQARLVQVGPMHWALATDKARIDIFGTLHLGLPGKAVLSPEVLAAFDGADHLLAELSSADLAAVQGSLVGLLREARLPPGRSLDQDLSEEDRATLSGLVGEQGYGILVQFNPWVMSLAVQEALFASFGYDAREGLDLQLYARAQAAGRLVEGLDKPETQLAILTAGSYEDQVADLKDGLERQRSGRLARNFQDLTAAYASGDSASLEALLAESKAAEAGGTGTASYEAIFVERNRAWAAYIGRLLAGEGRTFLFAGAGHFVGPDSVFEVLRAEGLLAP